MQRLAVLVVWGAVLLGVAGAVVALLSRGNEEVFQYRQSRSSALASSPVLSAARVDAVVALAPEPVAPAQRTPSVRVRCRPEGGGTLRNPWWCTILYRSGTSAYYSVVVEPDGHLTGIGTGTITGCCVKTPTLD